VRAAAQGDHGVVLDEEQRVGYFARDAPLLE
jgi:hypothetical protein